MASSKVKSYSLEDFEDKSLTGKFTSSPKSEEEDNETENIYKGDSNGSNFPKTDEIGLEGWPHTDDDDSSCSNQVSVRRHSMDISLLDLQTSFVIEMELQAKSRSTDNIFQKSLSNDENNTGSSRCDSAGGVDFRDSSNLSKEKDNDSTAKSKSPQPDLGTSEDISHARQTAQDITKQTTILGKKGFHFVIPQVVHAFNQLQAEAVRSSYPKDEINKYYDESLSPNHSEYVVTGMIGMNKTRASLLLLERCKNMNNATPILVTNIKELESIQVLPEIIMTILVDGLFDQIPLSLGILNANISCLQKFRQLFYNWSKKNTMIISMQKEVLNFLRKCYNGNELEHFSVVDFTEKVEITSQELFTHINEMNEHCFACLSKVLLNPGVRFNSESASYSLPSDLFRKDFMVQQEIAESFVGIYLEKKNGCFFIKDGMIKSILSKIHFKRNPDDFIKVCPMKYLCDFLTEKERCIIDGNLLETLISRLLTAIKTDPSHSLFEDFVCLYRKKTLDKNMFSSPAVRRTISQFPRTIRAYLANIFAESFEEDFSAIIQILENENFSLKKNSTTKSFDDISRLSDEKKTSGRSSFMAIACELDIRKYKWGQKTRTNDIKCISNRVLEHLLTSDHMDDTLHAKIIIRAIEQNFCSEFSVGHESIWTGYRVKNKCDALENYVIVVRGEIIKQRKEMIPSKYCGLEVLIKEAKGVSGESFAIKEEEAKHKLDKNLVVHDWIIDTLRWAHSNITCIRASPVLSINYTPGKPCKTKAVSCIVISCHTKGIIPMGEKPFPTSIIGYPVDVRESQAAISALCYPQMGDSIKSSTPNMDIGTLGGFVFADRENIYYLTAAHVLVVNQFLNDTLFRIAKMLDTKVLRKIATGEWKECGKIARGYFGNIHFQKRKTVDAILVKVEYMEDKPVDTVPPQIDAFDAGFLEGLKPYFTGTIKEFSSTEDCKSFDVVKYGQTTKWTRGKITGINVSVNNTVRLNLVREFKGQIEIEGCCGNFADLGDSGSLVFIVEDYQDPELKCIGLLNSVGKDGKVYVTPIAAVLKSLQLDENALKNFTFPSSFRYLKIINETQALHTDILLNIEETTTLSAS